MHQHDAAQDGFDPTDHALDQHNVSRLRLVSTIGLGTPYTADAPVLADGVLYVTGYGLQQPETLYAFPASCATHGGPPSSPTCQPLWTATVGFNAQPRVAVGDGMVFVGSNAGPDAQARARLWAFPEQCGRDGAACAPSWVADFSTNYPIDAAPTVADGEVYVSAGFGTGAAFYAFDVDCGIDGSTCAPRWQAPLAVASLGSPAVAAGVVYVTDYGDLRAFAVDCASSGATCSPLWVANEGIVGPPTVADGRVFITGGGFVWAFPADCAQSPCQPLWRGGGASDGSSAVAVADGLVYLVSDNGTLYALPVECRARRGRCPPRWTARLRAGHIYTRFTTPAVVDDVLFVTWTTSSTPWVAAFPTTCGTASHCNALWHATTGHYELLGPAVVEGRVFLGGGPLDGPGAVFTYAVRGD
jgi:hypothetical protein